MSSQRHSVEEARYYVTSSDAATIHLRKAGSFGISTVSVPRASVSTIEKRFAERTLVMNSGQRYRVLRGCRKKITVLFDSAFV